MRLEEASQDHSVTKSYDGRTTIEHVLPQAMKDPYWTERFTPEEHADWLHCLGNLALLAGTKNYRAQNHDFPKKKAIYAEKNKNVSFDLTKEILAQEDWTPDAVADRHERLMQLAEQVWKID
jgi:bacterioferritin (cytochrome b1)